MDEPPETRRLDAAAVGVALRRLLRAPEPPWLHGEVARRMAERLAIIRLKPAQVLDWWGWLGAGGELLAEAYPQAQRIVAEPLALALERSLAAASRPWWNLRRGSVPQVLPAGGELHGSRLLRRTLGNAPAGLRAGQAIAQPTLPP